MPEAFRQSESSLLPSERPRCPKCQGRMMLARIEPGCACRKSNPNIFVVQSAEDWAAKNTPCPLHGAR
jgi:hypothetical protein